MVKLEIKGEITEFEEFAEAIEFAENIPQSGPLISGVSIKDEESQLLAHRLWTGNWWITEKGKPYYKSQEEKND